MPQDVDRNGDGSIDFEEFMAAQREKRGSVKGFQGQS